jgi:SecD/SecF fusion protein
MSKSLRSRFLIIFGVLAGCILFAWPLEKRINLGLDLKGGMHLILKVETDSLPAKDRPDAVLRAMEILRNRIDSLGVGETVVQRQGENNILVQLPGVTDRETAVDMVKRVAHLEFHLVDDDSARMQEALKGSVPEGVLLKTIKDDNDQILISAKAALQGSAITDAKVDFDQTGISPQISLSFNAQGTKDFAALTQDNVGKRLAIVLDGEVLSAPNIREPILTGSAQISGQFTFDEASLLALALRSGSLPVPIHIEEERTVGPLLGQDSINAGFKAVLIGALLVFFFMIVYYMIGGLVATLALMLNLIMTVGIMGFLNVMLPNSQVTLTLPGIAGLALTLGMAVDANILINERMREEIDNGRPLAAAVNAGYDKALTAIIDSNVTTIIAAFMLFQFGSGPIKGFAVTLTIGLLASLFSAVYVTRTVFMLLLEKNWIKSLPMLRLIKETKIDFIGKAPIFIIAAILLMTLGLYNLYQKKDTAYGIDFAGGQVQEYRFTNPLSAEDLRKAFKNAGVKDAVIQQFAQNPQNVIIRTPEDTYELVQQTLKQSFPGNAFETLRIEKVGPVVGQHLRTRAFWALLLALLGIIIYVWFRFKHIDFAVAGVIALLHDVFIAMGITVLLGRQIDLLIVTAFLTIAGYSINDTIVIYDRVRENIAKSGHKKFVLKDVINLSLNQTLGRTLLTSLATLLVVIAFYFFGGEVLNTFALTLVIGFIAGIFSTMYIVSPLVIWWNLLRKTSW